MRKSNQQGSNILQGNSDNVNFRDQQEPSKQPIAGDKELLHAIIMLVEPLLYDPEDRIEIIVLILAYWKQILEPLEVQI